MTEKCNIAIVGYGGIAKYWHIPRLSEMPDEVEICGIYDIAPAKQQAIKDETPYRAYESMDELFDDKRIQLALVCIPNDVHKAVSVSLMDHHINVICEKPVTMSTTDLDEMIEASKRNHVIFTVHQNRRWDEDFLIVKKLYDENTLGKIFNIESRVHGSRGIPGDWRNTKEHGGGMVLDWGIHLFDQLMMLTNGEPIVSVYANLSYVTNEAVDDGFKVLMRFESGLTCHVEVGTSNFIELPRWYVMGENGSAVITDWNVNGKIVKVTDWENREAVPVATAAGLTKTMAPRTNETIAEEPLPRIKSDIKDFYRNVIGAIRGEQSQLITHQQLKRTMKFMEAVFVSAANDVTLHGRF